MSLFHAENRMLPAPDGFWPMPSPELMRAVGWILAITGLSAEGTKKPLAGPPERGGNPDKNASGPRFGMFSC